MEVNGQFQAPNTLPLEEASDTHWIGGCVDFWAGLDAVAKKKVPAPVGNRIPVVQLVVYSGQFM
jgi:hypothetical protein